MKHCEGYDLFNTVEDEGVRIHDRAVMMRNIIDDHKIDEDTVSNRGYMVTLMYFKAIPEAERSQVITKLSEILADA